MRLPAYPINQSYRKVMTSFAYVFHVGLVFATENKGFLFSDFTSFAAFTVKSS